MMRQPFTIPDEVIVDPETGYTVNMPLGPQDYPGWQNDKPEVVQRIMEMRKERSIVVADDEWSKRDNTRRRVTRAGGKKKVSMPKKRTRR